MAKRYILLSIIGANKSRSKYRKLSHHHKKVKTDKDLSRGAWREETQVNRDKAKRLGVVKGCFSDGVPPWLKRQCNKTHRRWEKSCIKNEEFERFSSYCKRKDIFDPWLWF